MTVIMRHFTVFALSVLVYEQTVFTARVDQRQTGDLNVQIDLKNLQIVGLMKGKEEYVDYDYAYDYSEMTIKPSSGTTKKPLNVTEPAVGDNYNTTAATTVSIELDQTTSSIENSHNRQTEIIVTTTPAIVTNDSSTVKGTAPSSAISDTTNSNKCKKGFFRNSKGNCELQIQNPSALLKMIKQKSKLNGSRGRPL